MKRVLLFLAFAGLVLLIGLGHDGVLTAALVAVVGVLVGGAAKH